MTAAEQRGPDETRTRRRLSSWIWARERKQTRNTWTAVMFSVFNFYYLPLPLFSFFSLSQVGEDVPDARKCACASHVATIADFFQVSTTKVLPIYRYSTLVSVFGSGGQTIFMCPFRSFTCVEVPAPHGWNTSEGNRDGGKLSASGINN